MYSSANICLWRSLGWGFSLPRLNWTDFSDARQNSGLRYSIGIALENLHRQAFIIVPQGVKLNSTPFFTEFGPIIQAQAQTDSG